MLHIHNWLYNETLTKAVELREPKVEREFFQEFAKHLGIDINDASRYIYKEYFLFF